jgi:cytoskeletal protein RodZ
MRSKGKHLNKSMKINEITNATEVLNLWKLISDNTWSAIQQQAEQEAREKAEKAAVAKSKRSKRGGGRKSAPKSVGSVSLPSLSPPKQTPPKASDGKAAVTASKQANKPAPQLPLPQSQGPLPRLGAAQVAKFQNAQQVQPAQLTPNAAMPQTPKTAVLPAQTARPKLSARHGGMVVGDTPI